MSADATDPPLCQYDRGYSAVVSTLCQPMRQIHRCVSMTEATQSVVSTLCQPMRQIHRCVSMTEATQL